MYSRTIIRSIAHYKVNTIIKVLIASDFIVWSSYQLFAPIFAVFVTDNIYSGSLAVVGIASALYLVSKSIFEIFVGVYVDRTRSEKDDLYTAIFGTFLTAVVYFLYIIIGSVWELYGVQILLGIGSAIAYPGWYSIFTHHIDKGKEAFEWSLYDVLTGLGMAGSAALGGLLADRYGFDVLFAVVGITTIIGGFLLVLVRSKVFES